MNCYVNLTFTALTRRVFARVRHYSSESCVSSLSKINSNNSNNTNNTNNNNNIENIKQNKINDNTEKKKKQYVLGIETSCDDTGVAIVSTDREVIAEVINSQWAAHKQYGGVVPVVATREHKENINKVVEETIQKSGLSFSDLSCVAVTSGPGMAYCLEVGIKKAKEIVAEYNLPLIGVNHMEGHALTARLTNPEVQFPFLVFLVSGGHTQLTVCKGVGDYVHLGSTLDNALGEVYDKMARELNVSYVKENVSGGEAVEELAKQGNPKAYTMTELPLSRRVSCDFSFSGILSNFTKLIRQYKDKEQITDLPPQIKADFAASFQHIVLEHIAKNTKRAISWTHENVSPKPLSLVVSGGVARNSALRSRLSSIAETFQMNAVFPPVRWCSDNGVMIAWAGVERYSIGLVDNPDDVIVRPKWPLDKSGVCHFPSKSGNQARETRHKSNYVVDSETK